MNSNKQKNIFFGVPNHAPKSVVGRAVRYIFFAKKQKRMPLPSLTRHSEQTLAQTSNQRTSSASLGQRVRRWTSLFLFLFPFFASAQIDTTLRNSVLRAFNTIRTGQDSEKMAASAKLEANLAAFYSNPAHFNLELDSVPFLGQLSSSDGVIKMLCWNLVLDNGSYQYHNILRHKPTKETVSVTVFQDNSDWNRIDRKLIRPNKWYGALYYKILTNKHRRKTYYTLLGWDGKDNITNRKVIDVISIQGNSVMLGSSIFKNEQEQPVHRLIYEYANDVSMALNYDEAEKMIVMDHLAPEDSRFTGQYQFYGPDFSYDGLRFKKGEWLFERDVFAKNRGLNNLPDNARPGDFKD